MNNNKKGYMTLVILGMLVGALLFTGCTGTNAGTGGNAGGGTGGPNSTGKSLDDIVEGLYSGVDVPAYETITLTKDMFESYAFTSYDESLSAVAADALVNITPHSLVVIHASGGNGKDVAEKIVQNADPNKWLCVGSEVVNVAYTNHYVVLVMSYQDIADGIVTNFKTMASDLEQTGSSGSQTDAEPNVTVLTAGNDRYGENF